MKMKTFPLIFGLAAIMSVGGVAATWSYASAPAESATATFSVKIDLWEGSTELPDSGETGTDHVSLVQNVITQLNTNRSTLNNAISGRKLLGFIGGELTISSLSTWTGDTLKTQIGIDDASSNVEFVIDMVSIFNSNTYYLYTFDVDLSQYKEGDIISPVYCTTMVKSNNTWAATETVKGYAPFGYYKDTLAGDIPSISVSGWKKGEPPTST